MDGKQYEEAARVRVIAVDFDGCLVEDKWPSIGLPNWALFDRLKEERRKGSKVILWTCREGDKLEEAVHFCMAYGLFFDAVNDNLPERKALYGNNCRKVGADEYWDDRAVEVKYPGIPAVYGKYSPDMKILPERLKNNEQEAV